MAGDTRSHLLKHVSLVEDGYSLRQFNPLGAGGIADFFTVATNTVELAASVKAAIDLKMPYVVVGEGAATLFSDAGFPGLVIHNQSTSFGIAQDKSQVVVDSGLSISRFVTLAVGRGLGGLLPYYGFEGTVGGALYNNTTAEGQAIYSLVRYVTMLIPPAKIDREATIVRYRSDWLARNEEQTKLQHLRATRGMDDPQPVILTVLFQLTNLRTDELQARMQQKIRLKMPAGLMGPIFHESPDVPLSDLLTGAQVAHLQVGGVYPDRYFPNYLTARSKPARASDIRALIEEMADQVEARYHFRPRIRYEFAGVW